mgnify:CR=1 FL=1
MIILGVDPGLRVAGYALARKHGAKVTIFDYGDLTLSPKKTVAERVHTFFSFFEEKITQNNVSHIVLETPFLGKNAQSFLKLGYLRGVLLLLGQVHKADVLEFAPRTIKQAVTGYGHASKEQVAQTLMHLFPALKNLKKTVKQDVTDAIAICMTGLYRINRHR